MAPRNRSRPTAGVAKVKRKSSPPGRATTTRRRRPRNSRRRTMDQRTPGRLTKRRSRCLRTSRAKKKLDDELPPEVKKAAPKGEPPAQAKAEQAVKTFILDNANDPKSVEFAKWGPHDLKAECGATKDHRFMAKEVLD